MANGIKAQACQNASCCVTVDGVDVAPIFVNLGVSVSEFADASGNYSITVGYKINNEAYGEYVDGGYTLSFGIVVSAYNVTGATPLICENGEVIPLNPEKTIFTKQAELLHNYVDIKVTGISAANNGAELVVCMFACDGEGVYYLNEKSQSTEAETVTINF
jgi:hypothetical protein